MISDMPTWLIYSHLYFRLYSLKGVIYLPLNSIHFLLLSSLSLGLLQLHGTPQDSSQQRGSHSPWLSCGSFQFCEPAFQLCTHCVLTVTLHRKKKVSTNKFSCFLLGLQCAFSSLEQSGMKNDSVILQKSQIAVRFYLLQEKFGIYTPLVLFMQ